ncbi:MAG: monofunctional biosynthetic peptidoglycan transglycosylase [Acetobacteraceae bacterium]|nr:monofunctional biosynthetic peptidoglycan transglycosylase [Acetobacteraceae bacterium]
MSPRNTTAKRKVGGNVWAPRIAVQLGLLFLLAPLALILLFRFVPPPITPLMLIRLLQGYSVHYQWVPYDRIAPVLIESVIASEDDLFCREAVGFDFKALVGQIAALRGGERPRGASTITMQTAKNLLLWPGRDPVRKVIEIWLTPQLALLWPKRRVLEIYLNVIEFGPGVYGAEAAALRFFGRHASQLKSDHALRLALVLPAPLHRSAVRPDHYLRERTEVIRSRINQLGPLLDCTR